MKKLIKLIKILLFLFCSFLIINLGLYGFAYITPKITLKSANQITIYDNKNEIALENIDDNKWVELNNISKNVIQATISLEDKNFYKHNGFDYLRIIKAMCTNIIKGKIVQGASTISQQYVKNLFLDFGKTWKRKIEEAYLTLELEVHYTKNEILEGYLNTINYGSGNYGIESASNYYFNKSSKDLSLAEATILVGIPKNPTYYNPISNLENSKRIQKSILKSMVNNNFITEKEMYNSYNEELDFYAKKENKELSSVYYFKDAILYELDNIKTISSSLIDTGGLNIYTTLDLDTQSKLENTIKKNIDEKSNLQVASIVVEPNSGKTLALVGGLNYSKSQYNRVFKAKRQVGSTIKSFLYYNALENGFTSSSTFTSEPTTFNIGNNKTYSPKNYGNIYANRNISLASAIAYSDNVYAVKTHLFLGTDNLSNTIKRVGIKTNIANNPSAALGTSEITMFDYSNGFSTLANNGIYNETYLIEKITDSKGNILYEHKHEEEKVLNSRYVYILNELLSNTYNYSFVDYSSPTMLSIRNTLTSKYAVKSGTTKTDCWSIGYNPNTLIMVWTGYDNNNEVSNNHSKIAKSIWSQAIEEINKSKSWYEIPTNVTGNLVNPITGLYEGKNKNVLLYYIKGTEPSININTLSTNNLLN